MAEESSSEDKTEDATPRRLEKAKEEGQIPRSRELTTSLVLLAGVVGLWVFGSHMTRQVVDILRFNFSVPREVLFDPQLMIRYVTQSFFEGLWMLLPFMGVMVLAALVAPIMLGGWLFSGNNIMPKFSRMDPLAGLKRMFSGKALIELAKALGKVILVMLVAYWIIKGMIKAVLGLSQEPINAAMSHMIDLCIWACVILSASTLLIAAVDVPVQLWEFHKKLKMTLQEVKDEMKDSEGRPEVKGRIRQLQREMSQRRMMENVPKADVIITNPTHYAIALQYHPDSAGAPILLAKGIDHTAMKIREIAKAHRIETVEAPVLARAIYHTTELDREIPAGLYVAVAQVLAYVFGLRNYRKGKGEKPVAPRNITVPRDMYFDP
jgi:flagellar biosynthesis protein FlhB